MMKIEDYTYRHQIISQANYLMNQLSGHSIMGTELNPKTEFAIRIFAYLERREVKIQGTARFKELNEILDDFLNSKLTNKKLSDYTNTLSNDLDNISKENPLLRDLLDQVEFLIILEYLDKRFNFLQEEFINKLLRKLKGIGNYQDYVELLSLFNADNDFGSNLEIPVDDLIIESLIELKLNDIITLNKNKDIYKKLKTRRLIYLKNMCNKLDLFNSNDIIKPSINLIYGVFISATVLELLDYNNVISLNRPESISYLDKELDNRMVEQEIKEQVENETRKIIYFKLPILKTELNLNLFLAVAIYTILWILGTAILYSRILTWWVTIFILTLAYGISLSRGSYVKTYKRK
jgi:hypothetical protein